MSNITKINKSECTKLMAHMSNLGLHCVKSNQIYVNKKTIFENKYFYHINFIVSKNFVGAIDMKDAIIINCQINGVNIAEENIASNANNASVIRIKNANVYCIKNRVIRQFTQLA